jgi:hypothetical protein
MAKSREPSNLASDEVEALKIGRKGLAPAMRNLVILTHHPNPSQQRQAIELLFKHTMADRNLQMQADGTIGPAGSGGEINITINKVDARLLEIMDNMPPHLKAKWGILMEELEDWALQNDIEVFEGEVVEELEMPTCECGCGAPVNKGKRFVKGHHFKKSVSSERVKELRAGNPLKMHQQAKLARENGLLPTEEQR